MTKFSLTPRDLVIAALGTTGGLLLPAFGVPVHLGQTVLTGPAAYALAAAGGALLAIVLWRRAQMLVAA